MFVPAASVGICERCEKVFAAPEIPFRNVVNKEKCPHCGTFISLKSLGLELHGGAYRKTRWVISSGGAAVRWSDVPPREEFSLLSWSIVPPPCVSVEESSHDGSDPLSQGGITDQNAVFEFTASASKKPVLGGGPDSSSRPTCLFVAVCQVWGEYFGGEKMERGYSLHLTEGHLSVFKKHYDGSLLPLGGFYFCVINFEAYQELRRLWDKFGLMKSYQEPPLPYSGEVEFSNVRRIGIVP